MNVAILKKLNFMMIQKLYNYSSIEYISFPRQIKVISEGMFNSCKKLRTVEFTSDSEI